MSEVCILVNGENGSNLLAVLITLVPWPAQRDIGLILTVKGTKVSATYASLFGLFITNGSIIVFASVN
jgi:hypothetical protein